MGCDTGKAAEAGGVEASKFNRQNSEKLRVSLIKKREGDLTAKEAKYAKGIRLPKIKITRKIKSKRTQRARARACVPSFPTPRGAAFFPDRLS